MFPDHLQASIVLIRSCEPENPVFGTGFVIGRLRAETLVLTCAHVVDDVGIETIKVENCPAHLWRSGVDQGIDLAILKVAGLGDRHPLGFSNQARPGQAIWTAGFQPEGEAISLRALTGQLGQERQYVTPQFAPERIDAWELKIDDDWGLQPGYSGSPVLLGDRETVVAIVRCRYGEGQTGVAVSTHCLKQLWQPVDRHQLHKTLLKLGYSAQARLFTKAIKRHAVAAFLIHGDLGYGQRWLLNRLIQRHLPHCLNGKTITIGLNRLGRRNTAVAFWRELGKKVNIRDRQPDINAIAQAVYQQWQTQDILIVFHAVDELPQAVFGQLIDEFWLCLADQTETAVAAGHPYKLLVFFLDYRGRVAQWDLPRVEKLDVQNYWVQTPRLSNFSPADLTAWLEYEDSDLPPALSEKMIEETVEEILENSENGIPDCVFEEICEQYCDLDWDEVQTQWLRF
ncbi:MAG: trypsin-like peptidase domain-containing protein [Cyanobacteria bacterium P01_G01_bin.54]